MRNFKFLFMAALLLSVMSLSAFAQCCGKGKCTDKSGACSMSGTACADTMKMGAGTDAKATFEKLPGYNKKCWIGKDYYFTYKFDKTPKMGVVVLKIQLFDAKGQKSTALDILGHSGMPSMGGAHDLDAAFKLNKKGEYLLPVNVVMPGQWEIKLTFSKDKAPIYRGTFKFNV